MWFPVVASVLLFILTGLCSPQPAPGDIPPPGAPPSTVLPVPEGSDADTAEEVVELETGGDGLSHLGIQRYRFVSVATVPGNGPTIATYRALVQTDPSVTVLTADGFVGDFQIYLTDDDTWVRRDTNRQWRHLDSNRPWRFSPVGPIPSYVAAGVISKMVLERGAEHLGRVKIGDDLSHHLGLAVDEHTYVETWIGPDGVVMRVRVTQETDAGSAVTDWRLYDLNGAFGFPATPNR